MRSELLEKTQENTTLTCKLKVANQMAFINLITEMGYRENKMWTDEEDEQLGKLIGLSNEHTKTQMKTINDHIKANF